MSLQILGNVDFAEGVSSIIIKVEIAKDIANVKNILLFRLDKFNQN